MSAAALPGASAAQFELVSRWHLAAPIDRVWDALKATEEWPSWWPYVKSVQEIDPGDADGLNAVRHIAWTSRLPYGVAFDVTVVEMQRPRRMQGRASGELEGVGTWELKPDGDTTHVRYTWCVDLGSRWMRIAAPLMAPVFRWNHNGVMKAGAQGLARHLGVPLLDAR